MSGFDSGFDSGFGAPPTKQPGEYTVLSPGGFSKPPYGSFAGKSVAGTSGRLLLINPPGLDGGLGSGGMSL